MSGEAVLPPEIIADILLRFDVKSLMVLKCVCKLWLSIIKSRPFIRMHMERNESAELVGEESLYEDGDDKGFKFTYIRNGLLLEEHEEKNKFRIRNPATKTRFDLPDEPLHKHKSIGFVYLPGIENYKVVNVFGKNGFGGCQVLTLGIDFLWRNLGIPNLNCLKESQLDDTLFVCPDSVAYIMWFSDASRARAARDIVCIDMETEGFDTVTAPEALFAGWENVRPMKWEDGFSLSKRVGEELHVWVLEDYRNRKWADSKVIISLSFLSKHASKSDKFKPLFSRKGGWLYFCGGNYRIWYNVESKREQIIDRTRENLSYIMKFSLRNPNASIPVDY